MTPTEHAAVLLVTAWFRLRHRRRVELVRTAHPTTTGTPWALRIHVTDPRGPWSVLVTAPTLRGAVHTGRTVTTRLAVLRTVVAHRTVDEIAAEVARWGVEVRAVHSGERS